LRAVAEERVGVGASSSARGRAGGDCLHVERAAAVYGAICRASARAVGGGALEGDAEAGDADRLAPALPAREPGQRAGTRRVLAVLGGLEGDDAVRVALGPEVARQCADVGIHRLDRTVAGNIAVRAVRDPAWIRGEQEGAAAKRSARPQDQRDAFPVRVVVVADIEGRDRVEGAAARAGLIRDHAVADFDVARGAGGRSEGGEGAEAFPASQCGDGRADTGCLQQGATAN